MILSRIFVKGDPTPWHVRLAPEVVLARLLDAEAQADEAGLPTERGFARFEKGGGRPLLVRPNAVAAVDAIEVDPDDLDDGAS